MKFNNSKTKIRVISLIELIILVALLSAIAIAIPNTLTLQGKLTNQAGASQQGTFNFTFRIYDAFTNGNVLWELSNYNITTDSNGVYDVILTGINLTFAEQYYLGITVSSDSEATPRINLTSAPYSFRANVSEALNPNNTYVANNLNVTNSFVANNTLFVNGSLVGIGTASPGYGLHIVQPGSTTGIALERTTNNQKWLTYIGGSSSLIFHDLTTDAERMRITSTGNLGIGTASPQYLLQVALGTDGRSVNLSNVLFVNGTNGSVVIGATAPSQNRKFEIVDNASRFGFLFEPSTNTSIFQITNNEVSGRAYSLRSIGSTTSLGPASGFIIRDDSTGNARLVIDSNGNVGIGTTSPVDTLTVVGSVSTFGSLNATYFNASYAKIGTNLTVFGNITANAIFANNLSGKLSCSDIIGSPDSDFCTDSTGSSSESTNNSAINVTAIIVRIGGINSSGDINSTTGIFSPFINSISNTSFVITENLSAYIRSVDFNIGNISNNTFPQTSHYAFNISNYLGNTNSSRILSTNLTTLDTLNNYIRTKDFNLGNISNYTEYQKRADAFNNVNLTSFFGNASINNSLLRETNQSFFNQFARSSDFNLGNISNYTQYQVRADAFNNVNLTSFFGNASANTSLLRETNQSFFNQFMRSSDFNLGNVSNNTLKAGDNESLALWNRTAGNTFLRFTSDKVGIGTPVPNNRLTIVGNDADSSLVTPGLLHLNLTDNYNNTLLPLLTLDRMLVNPNNVSTGAGQTSNLGLGILFRATNNDSEIINVSLINATLVNGFNGTEASALSFSTITNGGQLTPRLVLNGSDVYIGGNTGTGGAITVLNSGNVGIGTTSPNDILEVVGNVRVSGSLNATSINATTLTTNSLIINKNLTVNGDLKATGFVNFTNNTAFNQTLYLVNGNVGIGTTGPGAKLHVSGGNILLDNTYSLQAKDNGGTARNVIRIDSANDVRFTPIGSGNRIYFTDFSQSVNTLVLMDSGNVGIGTISPNQKLEISGNVLVNNTASAFVNLSGPIMKKSGNDIVISD